MSVAMRVVCVVGLLLSVGCDETLSPEIVAPVYASPCRYTDCSGSGQCVVTDAGAPLCMCDVGYDNASCSRCALGFHRDALNRCVSDRTCAEQVSDPCAPGGACVDADGVIACVCERGYAGPRCNVCAQRYARDPELGCLPIWFGQPDAAVDAGTSDAQLPCVQYDDVMLDFAALDGFPSDLNTCFSRDSFVIAGATLRSEQGDRPVRLCADSRIGGFTTTHIALYASPSRAAELEFPAPIVGVTFEYAATLQPLSLDVLLDGVVVEVVELEARGRGVMTIATISPITTATRLAFMSRTPYAQTIALDNVAVQYAECP